MVTSMWRRKVVIVDYEQIEMFQTRICDFSYPISDPNSSP